MITPSVDEVLSRCAFFDARRDQSSGDVNLTVLASQNKFAASYLHELLARILHGTIGVNRRK
jgi:hypothetical protein